MQQHQMLNYVLLGSQESLMREIFEDKKSPFYHFGILFPLEKIEKKHFQKYLSDKFANVSDDAEIIAGDILEITEGHPYYTQQLAYNMWNLLDDNSTNQNIVNKAVEEIIHLHDHDYERLWTTFNQTDKQTITFMALRDDAEISPLSHQADIGPASTVYSSLKRLMVTGCVIKTNNGYELDDPFFKRWIVLRRNQ